MRKKNVAQMAEVLVDITTGIRLRNSNMKCCHSKWLRFQNSIPTHAKKSKINLTGWLDDCIVRQPSNLEGISMSTLGSQITPDEQLLKVLKALSEKTRLRIIQLVSKGDVPCSEIVSHFDMTAPSLSHHFKILQESGLLITEKRGQSHFHSLNTELLENAIAALSKTVRM